MIAIKFCIVDYFAHASPSFSPILSGIITLLTLEQRLLLKNPFVPLIFRIVVLAFSGASLGLSAVLFENIQRVNNDDDPDNQCAPRASTYMAIVVGCLAIPYVLYVTWDEYMSKPYVFRSRTCRNSCAPADQLTVLAFAQQ